MFNVGVTVLFLATQEQHYQSSAAEYDTHSMHCATCPELIFPWYRSHHAMGGNAVECYAQHSVSLDDVLMHWSRADRLAWLTNAEMAHLYLSVDGNGTGTQSASGNAMCQLRHPTKTMYTRVHRALSKHARTYSHTCRREPCCYNIQWQGQQIFFDMTD